MAHIPPTVDRSAIVAQLERVDDPELDRSIVDLEYIEEIRIDGSAVTIQFVLPTAWCSPAFAWMMATGIRDEVGSLQAVDSVQVHLRDHMHGDQISTGVNDRLAFEEVFDDADGGIEAVRQSLDEKARLARQHRAVSALLDAGLSPDQIVGLTPAAVSITGETAMVYVQNRSIVVTTSTEPLVDYLEKARATGVVSDPDDPMFADENGDEIDASSFEAVQQRARAAAVNVEGQGAICAQLHEVRNDVSPEPDQAG